MAYTPHTWNNEVITDAKLNAIEQGVRTGTLLSGTDIDADKNWNGKKVSNMGGLEVRQIDTIIPLPPAAGRLIEVPPIALTPVVIGTLPGPYYHPGSISTEETVASYSVPSDLSGHGVPSQHRLVKVTVRYSMSSATGSTYTKVAVNGVECTPLRLSASGTASQIVYIAKGATIAFITYNGSNNSSDPVITNISVTLEGSYPFGTISVSEYATITNATGATLTPYHFSHAEAECTCNFDGALATMSDFRARPFFPQQPGTINLAWKSGNAWTATQPTLIFYRSQLSTTP